VNNHDGRVPSGKSSSPRGEAVVIAAIYARKSTDQSSVADEAKSVTRQVEHARQYAAARGWMVDEARSSLTTE